mgnify:CR=1 FL=1
MDHQNLQILLLCEYKLSKNLKEIRKKIKQFYIEEGKKNQLDFDLQIENEPLKKVK